MARRERQKAVDRPEIEDHAARAHSLDRFARAGEGAGKVDIQDVFELFRQLLDRRHNPVGGISTIDQNIDIPEASPQFFEHRHHIALDGHVQRFRQMLAGERCSQLCRCSAIFISNHDGVAVRGKAASDGRANAFCATGDEHDSRICAFGRTGELGLERTIHRRVSIPRLVE